METTITYATEEYFKTQIAEKDEQINSLTNRLNSYVSNAMSTGNALRTMTEALHSWTMENLENGNIGEEQATELADIGGFELTKEVEVEVNVTYYLTLQLPAHEDAESVVNDIDFDAIAYDSDVITHVNSSVDNIDI